MLIPYLVLNLRPSPRMPHFKLPEIALQEGMKVQLKVMRQLDKLWLRV